MKIDWLEMTRAGGIVQRYHSIRTVGEQNVAEHSFGVAMLVIWLCEGTPSMSVLKAALYHDLAEQIVGDSPAPVKWENPRLKEEIKKVEARFEKEWKINISLNKEEMNILHWADMLELMLWCREQRNIGNRKVNVLISRGNDYLRKLPAHSRGEELLNYIMENLDG